MTLQQNAFKKILILLCFFGLSGFSYGCGEDSAPKEKPSETKPDTPETTFIKEGSLSKLC